MAIEKLFSAGTLDVYLAQPAQAGDLLVVTFSHWHPRGAFVTPFGHDMLYPRGITAVHVVNRRSDWFLGRDNQADVEAMLAAIAAMSAVRQAPLRVGYGSSMGGYAALRFRDRLALNRVVAFAPQFSIDQPRVPFETRWRDEAGDCDFSDDQVRPIGPGDDVTMVYDPLLPMDKAHVALLDPHAYARHIAVPLSGHPPLTYFAQTGTLSALVDNLLHGRPADEQVRLAHARRRDSALFWQGVSEQMLQRHRSLAATEWAIGRGLALLPEDNSLNVLKRMVDAMR